MRKPKPLPRPFEKALRKIVYATKCQYEGHEGMCNLYDCTRHPHLEVKAVRAILRTLYGERNWNPAAGGEKANG